MRRILLALFVVSVVALTFAATAKADTILFPYINENPGKVSTIITVINGTACLSGTSPCPTSRSVVGLHYRYMTKKINDDITKEVDDAMVACEERNFCRPTSLHDIVSFDAAGNLNDGNALFNDPTAGGTLAYGASFKDTLTPKPRRGYLLVNHSASVADCGPANDIISSIPGGSGNGELDGEAMLIDIVNGEAWGYKAVTSPMSDFTFVIGEGVLLENGYSFFENTAIMPPSLFTTRYFITPTSTAVSPDLLVEPVWDFDMSIATPILQKRTRFGLMGWRGSAGALGVFNRNETFISGGSLIDVRCVAALSLETLLGSALTYDNSPLGIGNTGGWAVANLRNPLPKANNEACFGPNEYAAYVYQLTFGSATNFVGAPLTGLTNHAVPIKTSIMDLYPGGRLDNDPTPDDYFTCQPN